MAQGQGFIANGQLVKGSGCGTREWREDFALTSSDGTTALFSVSRASGAVLFPSLTTTARDALSPQPAEGSLIYNITTHKLNVRTSGAWEAVTSV